MNKTPIEWTDFSWNPIRARLKGQGPKVRSGTFCTRISPGCAHCYASTINKRFGTGLEYTVPNLEQHEFFIDERILEEPLRRKKPARIFVGDMFDIFHEAIPVKYIDAVVAAAAFAHWHTFQFLTKRALRMRQYFTTVSAGQLREHRNHPMDFRPWPLRNLWLGVSVEDQQRADERIPLLLCTPAVVRFLSVEPQLEEINILAPACDFRVRGDSEISWVICGGESGPGARPFNLAWAESLLAQCRAAGVPFFMKQLGARPVATCKDAIQPDVPMRFADRKGGNIEEWPPALRVREFPSQKAEAISA